MMSIDQIRDLSHAELDLVSGAEKIKIDLGGILGMRIYTGDCVRLNVGSLYITIGKGGVTTGVSTPAK